MNEKPSVICLTPVKNEAWILDTFLQCTSLWADYIIIADQQSTDSSREIALKYPKVILINNPLNEYNEIERQKLLFTEARKISGKRLLITLDADEFLTSDYTDNPDWNKMLQALPGKVFGFQWINVLPGFQKCWIPKGFFPWGFMDDGSEHIGQQMHNPRVPVNDWNMIEKLSIKILHFQYINWSRMESKQRYYQCLERIKYPDKLPVDIFRTYHHMYSVSKNEYIHCNPDWINYYSKYGIDITQIDTSGKNWFDDEVEELFDIYGPERFKREAIWHFKWEHKDPRSMTDKAIHYYLNITQAYKDMWMFRKIDNIIKRYYK